MTKFLTLLTLIVTSMSSFSKVTLFDSGDILKADLEMDISYFRANKEQLRENGIAGKLIVDGKAFNVEVLSRGQGSMDNTHPPFKLKFNKKESKGTLFSGIKKIKAFTSPDGVSEQGEKQVLSNYLTYKLTEKIANHAFKTRMFSIRYIDTSGSINSFESLTFLKEPNKNIAKRLNMTYIPFKGVTGPNDPIAMDLKSKLDLDSVEKITALEFLYGNWDHAIPGIYSGMFQAIAPMEKNMKVIKSDNDKYYPIAYDFDFSGFIDRNICWWEIGYNLMEEGRSDHFQNLKQLCDPSFIKKYFSKDLAGYHYRSNFIKHFPFMKQMIIEWRQDNLNDLKSLSPNYIQNLNTYLDVMEELIGS